MFGSISGPKHLANTEDSSLRVWWYACSLRHHGSSPYPGNSGRRRGPAKPRISGSGWGWLRHWAVEQCVVRACQTVHGTRRSHGRQINFADTLFGQIETELSRSTDARPRGVPCGLETLGANQVSYYPAPAGRSSPLTQGPLCARTCTRLCMVRSGYSVVQRLGLVGEMGHRFRREASPLKAVACFLTASMLQNRRPNQNARATQEICACLPACLRFDTIA